MIEINKIFNDDCFDIFPKIDDNTIDLVLVDLPFGCTSNDWDVKINLDKMRKQTLPRGELMPRCGWGCQTPRP